MKAIKDSIEQIANSASEYQSTNTDTSLRYEPFPVEVLPDVLSRFITEASEASGFQPAFVTLPLLAGIASAIGNTRRVMLKSTWSEPAILWTVIIGDSGTLKSPAIELALAPLRNRQMLAMKDYDNAMVGYDVERQRYDIALDEWKKGGGVGDPPSKPEEPSANRVIVDDVTIEALAVLLQQNWRGLLKAQDELAGWFGTFDRYARGKGGDVPRWLEMYGGRPMLVDRKTANAKTIHVEYAAVSVTGGIQPNVLIRSLGLEHFEDGLAARLLMAYPPRKAKRWTEGEVREATKQAVNELFDRLFELQPNVDDHGNRTPRMIQLSPEAKRIWVQYYKEHAAEQVCLSGPLAAAWSKLEGYTARLALVVHMVRVATGECVSPDQLDAQSMNAGVTLSRWFGQEAKRVYSTFHEEEGDHSRRELIETIQRHGGVITIRELMRSSSAMYPKAENAEAALDELVAAGLGCWQNPCPSRDGGRPTSRFVLGKNTDSDKTPIWRSL